MLIIQPNGFIPKRRRTESAPPLPAELTLVAAQFLVTLGGRSLQLAFDRAINIGALNASQLEVDDGTGTMWQGDGDGLLIDPQTMRLDMNPISASRGDTQYLNATADTGIVPDAGGDAWAGVMGLGLPFP